jgi:hypothetical protein
MKKIKLSETSKSEFMEYAKDRVARQTLKVYTYLTDSILENMYDWFVDHNLTVEENAKSYYYKNGIKEILCCGYSGYSVNVRDDREGIIGNLFHEVWCEAEWLARSPNGEVSGHLEAAKQTYGREYKKLLGIA